MNVNVTKSISDAGSKDFFRLVISLLKRTGKFAWDEVKTRQATDEYAESFLRRFGSIKILGMTQPTLVQDLYTEVHITNPQYRIKERIIQDLENEFRKTKGDFFSGLERISGLQLANQREKLNVLGAPGSGKSTFLKKVGLESLTYYNIAIKEKYEHECIPVLIELKRFKSEKIDLKHLLKLEFEIAGFPDSTNLLDRLLNNGTLLILLDGLDEVPESKLSDVLEHIKDFTDKYKKNRYISSCRTAHYKGYLSGFTDVEITGFNDDQINQFIDNWFSKDENSKSGTANLFKSLLFHENNSSSLGLARTPLLLAYLCMTFDETQKFPANRSSLYKQSLQILMQRWAAEKRIHNEDIYQDLNIEVETEMLADVAAHFFQQDKIFFKSDELKIKIRSFLDLRISAGKLNVSKILEAIEIQQGILVERSSDIYSFSHLTIQEYLTSHYFNSPLRIHVLTNKYLLNKNWREVFLLLTGTGDPNDTLTVMINELVAYGQENKIVSKAIEWVQPLLRGGTPDQAASKRIFLVSLLLRFKRYDKGFGPGPERIEIYANELSERVYSPFFDFFVNDVEDNISPKLANSILTELNTWFQKPKDISRSMALISEMRPHMPLSQMFMGSRQAYRREIIDEFYKALEVPSELCNRRRPTYNPIVRYMEAFSLILDCAKESPLTTKQTMKNIFDSIFTSKPDRKVPRRKRK